MTAAGVPDVMLAERPPREYTLRRSTGFGETDHEIAADRGRLPLRAAWVRSSEVEHLTFNQEVPGSIPGAPTIKSSENRLIVRHANVQPAVLTPWGSGLGSVRPRKAGSSGISRNLADPGSAVDSARRSLGQGRASLNPHSARPSSFADCFFRTGVRRDPWACVQAFRFFFRIYYVRHLTSQGTRVQSERIGGEFNVVAETAMSPHPGGGRSLPSPGSHRCLSNSRWHTPTCAARVRQR